MRVGVGKINRVGRPSFLRVRRWSIVPRVRRWPAGLAMVLTLVAVLATSGCTGDSSATPTASSTPTSSPPSISPTVSPTPDPEAKASAAAIDAYYAFWAAQVRSQANPRKRQDPNLAKYGVDKALANAQATLLLYRQNGIEMRGKPAHDAKVTAVDLGPPPTVSITDCLDSTHWKPVYAATGKSALAPGQSLRVVVDSTATLYNGRWVIRTSVAHRDRPC